ncbi:plastid division protein PDV2-like [Pyrus x bretschneideri]|uniref:plastid division protein PDV2-like n=1 Tax=Pyrus x bretschneideri TaxID=225117 RepID=UPI00202EE1B4|nr:plastid division protein PDV2-like [Pyrus x bretschneideri]
MEEEGIGLVLGRATELRLKISNCIHKANHPPPKRENGIYADGEATDKVAEENEEEEVEEEEAHKLFNICDALESLENQLSSLQALQQQQTYEREVALSEIESSRKMLLDKLKEYKGEELEVLREASAFAGETVEHNNDLLLPPYPSRSPHILSVENGYLPPAHKSPRNGITSGDPTNEAKKNLSETDKMQSGSKNSKGLGFFLSTAAKTLLTIVGVASVLSLSGFGPKLVRSNAIFKISGLSQQPQTKEQRSTIECPPGRVLVVEDGKGRCVVKERVEVPFSSVVARPDVNYGCG